MGISDLQIPENVEVVATPEDLEPVLWIRLTNVKSDV